MNREVDLIPSDYALGQRVQRRGVVWILIGSLAMVAVLGGHLSMRARLAKLEATVSPLRERVVSMRGWDSQIGPLARNLQEALDKYRLVKGLTAEPFWGGVLGDLSSAAGDGLWVDQLSVDRQEEERGQRYVTRITGTASSNLNLIAFMAAFSASEHVVDLTLDAAKVARDPEGIEHIDFEMEGSLK